ncbi:AraC family transcriptional regulator ligand-binding domain-containing protein [Litorimonas sp. WD9-15]|uniref:AraC family transcriptional regulator n=1 Tax=Litorimonas sp. WD9-15 TaxID=3418716 RepID=UPI003D00DD13
MKMTLSHRYLDANLDVLDKIGFPKADSLESLELAEGWMGNPTDRFPIEPFLTLLETAAIRLDDPFIGLRMGHRFRIATFAKTGSIYGYCRNLAQVIEMNARYQHLAIDAGTVEYDHANAGHLMRFRPYYSDQNTFRHITDLVMGAYGTAYRWLSWASGEDLMGTRLPYDRPHNTDLYERVFQCPVTFSSECGTAALVFTEAAMSENLTTYDAEKLTRAQAQLDSLLNTKQAAASLDMAVDAAIRGAIQSGRVSTLVVAERLDRDWPALRKALKETDRNFWARVDGVRQNMFIDLISQGHSLSQISQALAYNDQAAFNRAFKRWYNMSPTAWLKANPPQAARPQ